MTEGWSRSDVFFVAVVVVVFVFGVVVPAVRRHRDAEILDPDPVAPVVMLRRWRRPPD